jgi:hypothetical protein
MGLDDAGFDRAGSLILQPLDRGPQGGAIAPQPEHFGGRTAAALRGGHLAAQRRKPRFQLSQLRHRHPHDQRCPPGTPYDS